MASELRQRHKLPQASTTQPPNTNPETTASHGENADSPKRNDTMDVLLLTLAITSISLTITFFIAYYPFLWSQQNDTTSNAPAGSSTQNEDSPEYPDYTDPDFSFGNITVFTKSQLSLFNGRHNRDKLHYLSVLNEVFDVTGATQDFYRANGGYHHFVGTDATRGYYTGDNNSSNYALEAVTDEQLDVTNMSQCIQVAGSIVNWVQFYRHHSVYKFVGVLDGLYWNCSASSETKSNEIGPCRSTQLRNNVLKCYHELKALEKEEQLDKEKYPSCGQKWNQRDGTIFFCDRAKGFVPRKRWSQLRNGHRCSCVSLNLLSSGDIRDEFEEYNDCLNTSHKCRAVPERYPNPSADFYNTP